MAFVVFDHINNSPFFQPRCCVGSSVFSRAPQIPSTASAQSLPPHLLRRRWCRWPPDRPPVCCCCCPPSRGYQWSSWQIWKSVGRESEWKWFYLVAGMSGGVLSSLPNRRYIFSARPIQRRFFPRRHPRALVIFSSRKIQHNVTIFIKKSSN